MIDRIVGKSGDVYAVIDYRPHDKIEHCLKGSVLEYLLPDELAMLIGKYSDLVDGMALSLLDEVEEEIYKYGLSLKEARTGIFSLEVKGKKEVTFFDKYPTGKGFVDRFPD